GYTTTLANITLTSTAGGSGGGITSPTAPVNLVVYGDSIVEGLHPGSDSVPNGIAPFNPILSISNKGVNNDTISNALTEHTTLVDPLFVTGATNILIIQLGTNDICTASGS